MALSAELLLKGLGGLLAFATTTAGTWYLITKDQITKFDQGLIDYLNDEGDIQFKVLKKDGTTDVTDGDLSLSSGSASFTIKIKTTSDTTNGTLNDKSSSTAKDKGNKGFLKKLNGDGGDWTWICEIKLEREGDDGSEIDDEQKKRLLENANKGLFGVLKSTSGSNDDEKARKKKIKEDFIRNCAKHRKDNKMSSGQEIKTSEGDIVLKLKKNGSDKLVFSDESEFNRWFPTTVSQ